MNLLLKFPAIYDGAQRWTGFSGVRKKVIDAYLDVRPGMKVLDIGCGPGLIFTYLPDGIKYYGFDIDENYIAHARQRYGDKAEFHCRIFDEKVAESYSDADVVMLNGVLHHMNDEIAADVLRSAYRALKPGGVLFTLDGCYVDGQSWIVKKLLDADRGKFVRTESGYTSLVSSVFSDCKSIIREDLSPIPYTFIVMIAHKTE